MCFVYSLIWNISPTLCAISPPVSPGDVRTADVYTSVTTTAIYAFSSPQFDFKPCLILAFLWNLLSKSINTKQFFDIIEFSLRRQSRLPRIDCSLNINGHDFRQMNTFPSFVIKWSLKVFRSNIHGTPHRYLEPTQTDSKRLSHRTLCSWYWYTGIFKGKSQPVCTSELHVWSVVFW